LGARVSPVVVAKSDDGNQVPFMGKCHKWFPKGQNKCSITQKFN